MQEALQMGAVTRPDFLVERMAAGAAHLQIRTSDAGRHRSARRWAAWP